MKKCNDRYKTRINNDSFQENSLNIRSKIVFNEHLNIANIAKRSFRQKKTFYFGANENLSLSTKEKWHPFKITAN